MNKSKAILFDWGGTIIRDNILAEKLGNMSYSYYGEFTGADFWNKSSGSEDQKILESDSFDPDHWSNINAENDRNFFKKFLYGGEVYDQAFETINSFRSTSANSKSKTYIVFDNKPSINASYDKMQFTLARAISHKGGHVNGSYVEQDKINLIKRLNIDIIVDDDPRIILAAASTGVKSILISRLWNRRFSLNDIDIYIPERKRDNIKKNTIIAEDWYEVKNKISNLIKE